MSNYYLSLGISEDADIDKIKKAYRHYCKKYHPDLNEADGNRQRLQEINQAYEVLSDTKKREQYDRELAGRREELRIDRDWETIDQRRRATQHQVRRFSSHIDELLEGFLGGFFEEGLSREKELFLELILSREEAAHGGTFPITLPVTQSCSFCGGRGVHGFTVCPACNGYGRSESGRTFSLVVPPRVQHGTEVRITLETSGLPDIYLNLEIIIDDTRAMAF